VTGGSAGYHAERAAKAEAEVERLTEERDRLADEVKRLRSAVGVLDLEGEQLERERDQLIAILAAAREANSPVVYTVDEKLLPLLRKSGALSSLPEREDGSQAEAGGGKSRRSGEGPH
jgi:phage shock protein A